MPALEGRRRGRLSTPALLVVAVAVASLLAVAVRSLGRARRRARRRVLLAAPPEMIEGERQAAQPDQRAVDELRERPRAVGEEEAARILGLAPESLASLNIPVTRAADGRVVYDSWELVHWVEVLRADPAGLEARTAER